MIQLNCSRSNCELRLHYQVLSYSIWKSAQLLPPMMGAPVHVAHLLRSVELRNDDLLVLRWLYCRYQTALATRLNLRSNGSSLTDCIIATASSSCPLRTVIPRSRKRSQSNQIFHTHENRHRCLSFNGVWDPDMKHLGIQQPSSMQLIVQFPTCSVRILQRTLAVLLPKGRTNTAYMPLPDTAPFEGRCEARHRISPF